MDTVETEYSGGRTPVELIISVLVGETTILGVVPKKLPLPSLLGTICEGSKGPMGLA